MTIGQYPTLAELNKKLTELVELIAQPSFDKCTYDVQDFENRTGIDFMHNNALLHTVLDMLGERPEVKDFEIDKKPNRKRDTYFHFCVSEEEDALIRECMASLGATHRTTKI